MADTVDRLDIEIQAQASSAVAEVDKLYDALERVANVLNIATGSFTNAKTAIQGTARAMRSMAKINMPNLTTITQQMDALSQAGANGAGLGSSLSGASNAFYVLERSSSEANKSMSAMTPVVKGIETAFNGLMTVTEAVAHSIGSVAGFMVSNFTTIGRAASGLGKVKSLMSGILGPLIGFYGVRSLVTLGKDAVELASDLTEVQNVVDHAFGLEGAKAVETFVETSKEQFGLAELAAKQYSSRFQAMGKSMGITSDMVAKAHDNVRDHMVQAYQDTGDEMGAMALNLTKLTADMASFYNEDQAHVAQALQSVFTGQTRSLRQYGIDLTQVNLAEWAAKQGIDAKIDSMTQAEKAMLRYQYIMAQTSMVQGDFARTADTWANQIRLLKQNFQALGSVIGGVVINVFKPLITWMNNAMSSVIAFAETIANALGKIFGWTIRGTAGGGGGGDAGLGDLSGGLEDVGDAADGAGGSLGNANKKAKELKRTLLGFDEINKLNDVSNPSSGSGGSGGGGKGGGGGAGGGGASAGDFELVKTETIFDQFESNIHTLYGLGKKISGALSDMMESIDWQAVYKKARNFGSGLAEFLNGLISPRLFRDLGITIAGAINTVLNAKDAFLSRFNFKNLGQSLGDGIMGFFETWDAGLEAKVFYKAVNGIVDTIWTALDRIGATGFSFIGTKISTCIKEALEGIEWKTKVFPAAEEFGTDLAAFMNGLFKPSTFAAVGDTIAKFLNTELRTLVAWAGKFQWDSFGRSLAAGLKRFLFRFDWNLAASTFTKLAKGIITAAEEAIDTFASGNGFYVIGRRISTAIRNIPWDTLLASVGRVLWKALNGAIDIARGLFDGTPVSKAIEDLKKKLNEVAGKIDFPKIASGIDSVVKALTPAVSGFAKGFVEAFGGLADIGVIVLNGIGVALEIIANALNKLDPDLIEKIGKGLGVMAASLGAMKLANGVAGVITSVTSALGFAGSAGATAATGLGQATTAVEVGATTAMTVGEQWLTKLYGLGNGFFFNAGASAAFTEAVEHTFTVDKNDAYVGLTNALMTLSQNEVISTTEFQALEKYMGSTELKGKSLSEVAFSLGQKLGEVGVTTEDLTKNEGDLNKVMGMFIKNGGDKQAILDNISRGIGSVNTEGSKASNTGFGGLLKTMLGIGDNAETSDAKTAEFKKKLWTMAGGMAAQGLLLAIAGTTFVGIGNKADENGTKVAGFSLAFDGLIKYFTNKKKDFESGGEALMTGATNGVETGEAGLSAAVLGASQDAQKTWQDDNGEHSPSTVYKGFGENLMIGLANGITGQLSTVTTALQGITKTLQTSMTTFVNTAKQYGSSAATEIANGLDSVKMPDLGNKIYTSMSGRASSNSGSFYTAGQNMANAVKNGANSVGGFPDLGGKLRNAMGSYANSGSSNPFYTLGSRIANAFKDGIQSVQARLEYTQVSPNAVITVGGKQQSVPRYVAKWYASGGFPNYGEMFIANERGPEMIGKFGNKNVVANNQQITEGIEAAVVNGMMKAALSGAFGSSNDGTPIVLNATIKTPDGDVLARVVERAQARRDTRYYTTSIR